MKKSQLEKMWDLMRDGNPHSTYQIVAEVYDMSTTTIARVASRVFDMKKKYGVDINSWPDKDNPKMWWYQVVIKKEVPSDLFMSDDSVRQHEWAKK